MEKSKLILSFITEELLDDPEEEVVEIDTSLFKTRLLDSLKLISLITFLEETFEIKISPSEITIENLDTVNNILNFLERKNYK